MATMVTEPGLNGDGRRLLYRVRQFKAPYPLSLDSDKRGATRELAGGYVSPQPGDAHFVTLTDKGEAYLDRLMRCE